MFFCRILWLREIFLNVGGFGYELTSGDFMFWVSSKALFSIERKLFLLTLELFAIALLESLYFRLEDAAASENSRLLKFEFAVC
jgi:hypothetical protein